MIKCMKLAIGADTSVFKIIVRLEAVALGLKPHLLSILHYGNHCLKCLEIQLSFYTNCCILSFLSTRFIDNVIIIIFGHFQQRE